MLSVSSLTLRQSQRSIETQDRSRREGLRGRGRVRGHQPVIDLFRRRPRNPPAVEQPLLGA